MILILIGIVVVVGIEIEFKKEIRNPKFDNDVDVGRANDGCTPPVLSKYQFICGELFHGLSVIQKEDFLFLVVLMIRPFAVFSVVIFCPRSVWRIDSPELLCRK